MKLSILSELLQKKILFLNHAVSSRSQLPVLLNILLEAKNGKLILSATDLEIGIQTEIQASIDEEGSTTVPAKIFTDLINSLPHEKITLTTKDNAIEIVSKRTKTLLQTLPKDEFPKLYEDKGEEIALLKKENTKNDFSKVVFASSIDITRPALSGILIKKEEREKEKGMLLVATDGYRLSIKKLLSNIKDTEQWEKPLLIPSRVLKELLVIKEEGDITVFVSRKNNQVVFSFDDTVVVGRLIEADFPNYEKIIPSDYLTQALFDKEEMQKAVKICSIFARETANIIRLKVQKDMIVVSANTPSVGENTVEVQAKVTGDENEIAFNGRYLLELLNTLDAEEMVFEMSGALNPGVFKIKGDPSFLHIIMPIRVQG